MPTKKGKKIRTTDSSSKKGLSDNSSVGQSKGDLTDGESQQTAPETTVTVGDEVILLTGNFEEDFINLCEQYGMTFIPSLVTRGRRVSSCTRKPSETSKNLASVVEIRKKSHGAALIRKSLQPQSRKTSSREQVTVSKDQAVSSLTKDRAGSGLLEILPAISGPADVSGERRDSCDPQLKEPSRPYIRRSLQVEFHTPAEGSRDVRDISIRGWKVDDAMMNVLKHLCVSIIERLSLLHMWNTDLSPSTLNTLTSFLPWCQSLSTLQLDANPVGGQGCIAHLVNEHCPIQNLSLRFCGLTDMDAAALGMALGTSKTWNKTLITLNLSHNQLSDEGARHLAAGLMTNRTLLVLNLSTNRIGDDGASALAQVLSDFPLNTEQLCCRRSIFAERLQMSDANQQLQAKVDKKSVVEIVTDTGPKSKRMTSLEKRRAREHRKDKEASDNLLKVGKPTKRASFHEGSPDALAVKSLLGLKESKILLKDKKSALDKGDKKSPKKKVVIIKERDPGPDVAPMEWHPLAEASRLDEEGQLRVLGNRSLVSLNLSRNAIGEGGLLQMLDMLQVQGSPWLGSLCKSDGQPELLKPPSYCSFSGLRRLGLHGNAVSRDHPLMLRIQQIMRIKDPLYRVPILTLHRGNVPPCAIPPICD